MKKILLSEIQGATQEEEYQIWKEFRSFQRYCTHCGTELKSLITPPAKIDNPAVRTLLHVCGECG